MTALRYACLLFAVTFLVSDASAQDPDWQRFYPLQIGDSWIYELADGEYGYPIQLVGYHRRTVLRDTVLAGESYRLVRVDSLSSEPGYPVLADALCAVRVLEEAGTVEWVPVDVSGGGTCWAPEAEYEVDLRAGVPASSELYINARPHDFEAVKSWGEPERIGEMYVEAASDFGLVQWNIGRWAFTVEERTMMRVIHAVIGGEEYGYSIDSDAWRTFYPLNEGDVREGEYFINPCGNPWDTCTYYTRWDVGADTTIEGETYHLVRQREFNEDFEISGDRDCAMRVREDGGVEATQISGSEPEYCQTFLTSSWMDLRSFTWTVAPTTWGGERLSKALNEGSSGDYARTTFAEGVGVIRWDDYTFGPGGGSNRDFWLRYAVVGGVAHGSPLIPVSNEEQITPAGFALGAVYPNPFRESATLTLSLPAPDAVTLEVFDVLGRRALVRDLGVQAAGTQPVTLDLGAVPAGVYFVRLKTASGQTATRRIVRVE